MQFMEFCSVSFNGSHHLTIYSYQQTNSDFARNLEEKLYNGRSIRQFGVLLFCDGDFIVLPIPGDVLVFEKSNAFGIQEECHGEQSTHDGRDKEVEGTVQK